MMLVDTLRLPERLRSTVTFRRRAATPRPTVPWARRRRELLGRCVLGAVMLASHVALRVDDALQRGRGTGR
jgi:hypothetical protein